MPVVEGVATGASRRIVVRVPGPGWSAALDVRALGVTVALVAAAVAVLVVSLATGDYPIPVADVVRTLLGDGEGPAGFAVRRLRLPRGAAAVLVGAAFGISGAIFQRLVHNPLASPDVIGVSAGAATAAVLVIVVLGGTGVSVTLGAMAGSLVTALAIYVLAYRRGVTGYRLVLVGIGVTATLGSVNAYLLTRGDIVDVQRAAVWMTGNLNGVGWDQLRPLAVGVGTLAPAAILLGRPLRALDLGDDAATALGARVQVARGLLVLAGTLLAAVATAAAGPIGFVALVSPQISRRLVGARALGLVPAGAFGALLLVVSDLVARRAFAPTQIPVGIVTAVLGAPYLLLLLVRANRVSGHR